jgi:hypothetical protein
MQPKVKINRRQQERKQGVLPVRVRGKDASGAVFETLAHTLDLTPTGARLGAIHHQLNALDTLVVLFRQRRVQFSVVWTKQLDGHGEYQVGLQLTTQESDPWGLSAVHSSTPPLTRSSATSGAA